MLSVGKVTPSNAGYYESAVVSGVEDYYAGDGEAPGVWIGRADMVGAVAGNLATAVDSKLLLEAKCAPDGSRLGKTAVTERSVTAFDLTFSAPKSVSVLYALGDERTVAAVEKVHTAAVEQAVKSVSQRIAYTRIGHAGASVVDAEGVFGIRYRHRTSRALDPQLHDHVLISNAVRTVSDGEWRTLDARGLYRQAKAAGVEYQTHLRAGLRASLGVEFHEVDSNGQADIIGIDESLLHEFSTRNVDIETALDGWTAGYVAREGRPPSLAEVGKAHKTIVLATRPAKPDQASHPTATLRNTWRTRAADLVDVDRMLATASGKVLPPAVIVRPSVDDVLTAIEEKHAEWAEPQLIEQIAMRVAGPDPKTIAATIEEVRAEAMGSIDVVDLTPDAEAGDVLRSSDGRPVSLPPSAVRFTTSRHLQRELDIVDWATSTDTREHRSVTVEHADTVGLDEGQVAVVAQMLADPRPVTTVVGPAGAGKTRMLAVAAEAWQSAGVPVFGVGPSATAARQLHDGAGMTADTLHKLVYEHSTKQLDGRGAAGDRWNLPERSVVIVDEAGMVDTRLLDEYSRIARAKNWRTVLVGDHHQLDAVDAGGMFAELVHDPNVVTVELDTLHRFEHEWEAEASLALRNGDESAIEVYERHGRIHGHADQDSVVEAVAREAVAGVMSGRDVLVMAPTNTVVDALNTMVTDRLLATGHLDRRRAIESGGVTLYAGQPVFTRANDRTLRYGTDASEWVRNGDRWTVEAGTRDELYLINRDSGLSLALPADFVADGNVSVDYAATISRAQGATVDEAHVIVDDRTNARQFYVGATRGRTANHVHVAPPAFEEDRHDRVSTPDDWNAREAAARARGRQPDEVSAIARRRKLRESLDQAPALSAKPESSADRVEATRRRDPVKAAAARLRQLESLTRRPSRGLGR